jgi:hypothetical protein
MVHGRKSIRLSMTPVQRRLTGQQSADPAHIIYYDCRKEVRHSRDRSVGQPCCVPTQSFCAGGTSPIGYLLDGALVYHVVVVKWGYQATYMEHQQALLWPKVGSPSKQREAQSIMQRSTSLCVYERSRSAGHSCWRSPDEDGAASSYREIR